MIRLKQCAIQRILRIFGNWEETNSRALVTFDALSVTIAANFLTPIFSIIFKISSASFSPVWCSSVKSLRQYKYSWRSGVRIIKFHNERPVGDVQPSNAKIIKLINNLLK